MTALRHLRSDTANKRPDPSALSSGQLAINYEAGSPGLFFKDTNGNLVKAGPVHIGTSAPNATPAAGGSTGNAKGEFWLDTTTGYDLKVWDGSAWRSAAGEYVNITGDTMTGDLVLDNANLVFEGATPDSFETTLTVVDPTADRTITLPNVSGTVVTTGDTETVTSQMIANATIVDADISASAEIAVSKLADGTARQLLQTDAAGTGVEWTSNVDVPGTLDVTGAATFDSTLGVTGAATFTDDLIVDTNTLFVDASADRVGIGTTSPDTKLDLDGAFFLRPTSELFPSENGAGLRLNSATSALDIQALQWTPSIVYYNINYLGLRHFWHVNGSEKMQLDGDGRLLVGTSSAAQYNSYTSGNLLQLAVGGGSSDIQSASFRADEFGSVVNLSKSRSATLGTNAAVQDGDWLGTINFNGANGTSWTEGASIRAFADGQTWANGDCPGRLVFSTTADGASSPTERMRINANGDLLLNTTSTDPTAGCVILKSGSTGTYAINATAATSNWSHWIFKNGNGAVGSISTSGSATAYNTSSDYRLKENVVPLTGAIDRINQLRVHRFNFIADPDQTVDGFIAHEAQEVVPECVYGEKDAVDDNGKPVYQGIDQSKLVPLLTAALQEALQKIEDLETRLTAAGL